MRKVIDAALDGVSALGECAQHLSESTGGSAMSAAATASLLLRVQCLSSARERSARASATTPGASAPAATASAGRVTHVPVPDGHLAWCEQSPDGALNGCAIGARDFMLQQCDARR
ncbi:MAG: hypothetical protein R3C30_06245 [Hyphomonadaceae bacterium]